MEVPWVEDLQLLPAPAAADDIWETPTYSEEGAEIGPPPPDLERYAWIAAESGVVRTLRRCLVGELGWARHQMAFIGYRRQGVSMRS